MKSVIVGAVFVVIGLAISIGTIALAAPGGTYVVAWGPVGFGLFRVVRGLISLGRGR